MNLFNLYYNLFFAQLQLGLLQIMMTSHFSSASFLSQEPLTLINKGRHHVNKNSKIFLHRTLPKFSSSDLLSIPSSSSMLTAVENDIAFEDAFTDQINLNPFEDSTIQLVLTSFTIITMLAIVFKFFLNKMDDAIEKVLVDFERTMKNKYPSRWVSIQARIDTLDKDGDDYDVKRSQLLFEIMEDLQAREPEFMKKVNENMASS